MFSLSQGLLRLTGWKTGILATSVWTAATLCCCVRFVSSLQTCPSPLIHYSLSYLKAPPSIRSYRCACRPLTSSCYLLPSLRLFQQLMFYHVTERNHLPAGLRGFGRHPSQRDQRKAVVCDCSTVSSPPEPTGTAGPHRHPGELQVVLYRCENFSCHCVSLLDPKLCFHNSQKHLPVDECDSLTSSGNSQ